jgi:hypothetical protein
VHKRTLRVVDVERPNFLPSLQNANRALKRQSASVNTLLKHSPHRVFVSVSKKAVTCAINAASVVLSMVMRWPFYAVVSLCPRPLLLCALREGAAETASLDSNITH